MRRIVEVVEVSSSRTCIIAAAATIIIVVEEEESSSSGVVDWVEIASAVVCAHFTPRTHDVHHHTHFLPT